MAYFRWRWERASAEGDGALMDKPETEEKKTHAHLVEVDISPPDYLDPAQMLRNIADEVEKGEYGEVTSMAIVTFGDNGLDIFGGGSDSAGPTIALLLHAAHTKFGTCLLDAAMADVQSKK